LEQGGSIAQIVRNPITGDGTQHWFTLSAGLGFKNTTVASPENINSDVLSPYHGLLQTVKQLT
jgi:hypothetical protein